MTELSRPQAQALIAPPQHIVDLAVEVSGWSPCRSKRGVVIFSEGNVISHGHNYKPNGFECDGSAACKATCRREAVHAEQAALLAAGSRAHASEMLHVKTVDGKLAASGGPSCVECSKLARAAGIAWVWLYSESGWIPLLEQCGEDFIWRELRATYKSHEWPPMTAARAPQEKPEPICKWCGSARFQHGRQGQCDDNANTVYAPQEPAQPKEKV